jgi:hypothetical protein
MIDREEAVLLLARKLYETMENLEIDYPEGPPWVDLCESDQAWYVTCVRELLQEKEAICGAIGL